MLKDLYNRKHLSEVWHPFVLRPDAWSTHRFDDVARLLRDEKGRLLDIGCGAGHLVVSLAEMTGGRFCRLDGIDLSDVRVNNGRNAIATRYPHLADRIRLDVGDADKPLPFEDGSYDVVICCAVLEHLVNPFEMMREVSRVCRPNGVLILTVPNAGYIRHVKDLLLGRLPLTGIDEREISLWEHEGWDGGHLHYFTKHALGDLLKLVGFAPEIWTSDGRFAKLRRWSRLLSGNLTVLARKRCSSS